MSQLHVMLNKYRHGNRHGARTIKSWKDDFKITSDPKGSPSESNFWSQKSKMANKAQKPGFVKTNR